MSANLWGSTGVGCRWVKVEDVLSLKMRFPGLKTQVSGVAPWLFDFSLLGLIAGGEKAIQQSVEGAEDTKSYAVDDLKSIDFSSKDVLAGLAACGKTPYVIGGLEYAESIGAKTIAIACSKNSPIGQMADVKIEVVGGIFKL